jgi:hypothetical protein
VFLSLEKGIPTNKAISVPNGISHNTFNDSVLIHYPTVDDGDKVDIFIKGFWGFHISYHLLHSKPTNKSRYKQGFYQLFFTASGNSLILNKKVFTSTSYYRPYPSP